MCWSNWMFSSVHPHLQIRFALESLKWQQMIYFRLNDIIPLFQLNNQRLIKRVTVTFLNSLHFTGNALESGFQLCRCQKFNGVSHLHFKDSPLKYCTHSILYWWADCNNPFLDASHSGPQKNRWSQNIWELKVPFILELKLFFFACTIYLCLPAYNHHYSFEWKGIVVSLVVTPLAWGRHTNVLATFQFKQSWSWFMLLQPMWISANW